MVVMMSFVRPDSPILLEQRNVRVLADRKDIGAGTLYLSERTMCWDGPEIGFTVNFQDISLHGVSNDPTLCERECVLVLINARMDLGADCAESDEDSDDDGVDAESEGHVTQLLYVPEDPSLVSNIYEVIRTCQLLNPDPDDMDDEDDIYEDADEHIIDDLGAGGDTDMDGLVNQLHNSVEISYAHNNGDHLNEDIFEDAD